MDPVSLALGILPLCLAGVSGAKTVTKKIKVLRKYDREISRLRKRLKVQISIFTDECQLLLQEVVDDSTLEIMLDDFTDEHWNSLELETKLREHLGRKYGDLMETIENARVQIKGLDEEIDDLEQDRPNKGALVDAVHKARDATKVMLSKSKLDELVESLVESTSEFRRLRKVAKAFNKPRKAFSDQKKPMPRAYQRVARHSSSFYDLLSRTWSCVHSDSTHSKHSAKFLLNIDAKDNGSDLRLILGYEAVAGTLRQNSLLLRIRSDGKPLENPETGLPTPSPSPSPPSATVQVDDDERPAKVRRVRFAEASVQSSVKALNASRRPAVSAKILPSSQTNLGQSKDLCQDVFKSYATPRQPGEEACIGYLDSASFRHRVFMGQDRQSKAIETTSCSSLPLSSIFTKPRDAEMSVPDQLRLALSLARSVLQFHSSAWWRQQWALSDVSYFDIEEELTSSLGTLHIEARLQKQNESMPMKKLLEEIPLSPPADETLFCGIRNVTIYSLGAALLQIGRWEPLDADDVVKVRKKASQPSRLGPRYDELTMKCLYCDFGFGPDLAKPELQRAFYEDVIYELEQIVGFLHR